MVESIPATEAKQAEAAEIKLRAERKAGEMLREMGLKPGPKKNDDTLSSIGVTPKQSSRWQKEASVPDERSNTMLPLLPMTGGRVNV